MKLFRMFGFQIFQFILSDVWTFYSLHLKEEQSYKTTTKSQDFLSDFSWFLLTINIQTY